MVPTEMKADNQPKTDPSGIAAHYPAIFAVVLLTQLFFAWVFPATTDEAYWLILGNHLDVNYYDHPPMSGWMIYLFSRLGHHVFFARLYTILYGALAALGIYFTGKKMSRSEEKAKLASLAYLVTPLHVLFVLIATDTSLCVFVFLCGMAFYYGQAENRKRYVLLSGIFLGLAVLSKYFSGLFLIALLITPFFYKKFWKAAADGIILVAGAMPFVLLHLYWSANSCWTNIMFNVFSRNQTVDADYSGLVQFVLFQVYLSTPWLLFYLYRNYQQVREGVAGDRNPFVFLFLIPIALLGIVSIQNTGLHWYFSFYPFLFMLLYYLRRVHLEKIVRYSALLSLVHLLIVGAVLGLPTELFREHSFFSNLLDYKSLLVYRHGDEIVQAIEKKYGNRYVLATTGYSTSSVLTYHGDQEFIVFSSGSKYGRHFDKLTDFRDLDGKDILIFSTTDDYHDYFDQVTRDTLLVRGYPYDITLGHGFRYQGYRDRFLTWVRQQYYDIPQWLPVMDCFFLERYFPEGDAPR